MPLRAILDGEPIESFYYSVDQWTNLKERYKRHSLVTECCGHLAIPKVSKLGTQFFAHVQRGECTSSPETKEHLYLKSVVARAAHAAGWSVKTECRGTTPDGQPWVADVMCCGKRACFAVEIQWTSQPVQTYEERQARYTASGVRALWLYRIRGNRSLFNAILPASKDLPLFGVRIDSASGTFEVPGFGVNMDQFVDAMLAGHLTWRPSLNAQKSAGLIRIYNRCWKCRCIVPLLLGLVFSEDGIDLGYESFADDAVAEFTGKLLERVSIDWDVCIKRRFSKTAGQYYVANCCPHCDALQGRFHLHEEEIDVLVAGVPDPDVVVDVPADMRIPVEPCWYLRGSSYSHFGKSCAADGESTA